MSVYGGFIMQMVKQSIDILLGGHYITPLDLYIHKHTSVIHFYSFRSALHYISRYVTQEDYIYTCVCLFLLMPLQY